MATTMAYAEIDGCSVVVHTTQEPSHEEWQAWLRSLDAAGGLDCCLVDSQGGGPNPRQRKALHDCLNRWEAVKVPVAVVTTARMARGIITAMSWFGQNIRGFPPEGIDEALAFIGRPARSAELIRVVAELKARLGVTS